MTFPTTQRATDALRRFTRRPNAGATGEGAPAQLDRCELCASPLSGEHEHLIDPMARTLRCACGACALLFDASSAAKATRRYVRATARVVALKETALSEHDLVALGAPVNLVLLCPSDAHDALFMLYPSAAGPIEARGSSSAWRALAASHAQLARVEPDRDALIVDLRGRDARPLLQVSLDVVYELLGTLRGPARLSGFEAALAALYVRGGQRG